MTTNDDYQEPDYPLKSLWQDAMQAMNALVLAVMASDQEWHVPADHLLKDADYLLTEARDTWVHWADIDGRTS